MKRSRIYWVFGLMVLLIGCQKRVVNEQVKEEIKPIEMVVDKAETIVVDTSMTEGQIFLNEDEMLLALQGSWLWVDAPSKEINDYAWLWNTSAYFEEYSYGFVVRYLLTPTSMFITKYFGKVMDLDMSKLEIDLANNTLVIGSYYDDEYRLIFHFLSKERVEVSEHGTLPSLSTLVVYEGPTIYVPNAESPEDILVYGSVLPYISWVFYDLVDDNDVRAESPNEIKARLRLENFKFSIFNRWSKDLSITSFIFDKVDGFAHDENYNVYDKEGNFLMNPQMIRENEEHNLPYASNMQ
ncbi:hypothetical protein [Entomospira culicis]|uniref:Lipoprotein n=1 Tax=Entomospira culicis TaxID=2719989 RepID=A0A968GF10_9SPIO|nr:hypothetical protein [Entomospira culicis]NIZ19187.1 hypothetical protein [Entomospira culicis]NIZ69401.1 hypothetical protein [Entomospira culicis]WDI36518.1 hypothetical protein PVA46_04125 [Entomospira culicis]WDI38144.1 hypothetical protein PVA47_04125 [Entomospira culicis]